MDEILTIAEIMRRFDSEWVLLEDPEVDKQGEIVGGRLVSHSRNRDDVDSVMLARRMRHAAVFFTGKVPDDLVVML